MEKQKGFAERVARAWGRVETLRTRRRELLRDQRRIQLELNTAERELTQGLLQGEDQAVPALVLARAIAEAMEEPLSMEVLLRIRRAVYRRRARARSNREAERWDK